MYLFVLLGRRRTRPVFAAYVIVGVLLVMTHVHGLFIPLAQNVVWAVFAGKARRPAYLTSPTRWLFAKGVTGILILPWLAVLAYRALTGGAPGWLPVPGWAELLARGLALASPPPVQWLVVGLVVAALVAPLGAYYDDTQKQEFDRVVADIEAEARRTTAS